MAHANQERWSKLVDAKLRNQLVTRDNYIFNNRYEGDPKAGKVKIPVRDTEVSVKDYNKATGIDPEAGTTTYLELNIDQDEAVNELIDGFDAASVPDGIVADRLDSAGYSLGLSIDKKSIEALQAASGATISATKTAATEANAYKLALEAKRVLSRKGVPADGRFMIVSPEYLEVLMLDEHFIKTHPGTASLITVPTEYFFQDMQQIGTMKSYSYDFSTTLSPDILVLYTGEQVVGEGILDTQLLAADQLYGRKLGIWWNYPVTDYMKNKLALGPIEKLPRHGNIPAIFFNPMEHEQLSKIALATGADYALDPAGYQPQQSWEKAIREQYGVLAPAMQQVAGQSQHLENNWAKVGRPDGAALRKCMDAYWQAAGDSQKQQKAAQEVRQQLESLSQSVQQLQSALPAANLKECQPQLQQLLRIIAADQSGLALLSTHSHKAASSDLRQTFESQLSDVRAHDKEAVISETAARAFLNELAAAASVQ